MVGPRPLFALFLLLSPFVLCSFSHALSLENVKSEAEGLTAVQALGDEESVAEKELDTAINRGWWSVAQHLIQRSHKQGRDVGTVVRQAVANVKRQADELVRILNKNAEDYQVMSPAFQWAQSSTHVFIQIKFAYRWSAPGALSVENEVVNVTDSSFFFSGVGSHSQLRKKYELALNLLEPVDPKATEWSFGSVGKLVVTLKKDKPSKWKRLTKENKKIANMHVWWEMKEKHQSELDRLEAKEELKEKEKEANATTPAAPTATEGEQTSATPAAADTPTPAPTPAPAPPAAGGEEGEDGGKDEL